MNHTPGPWIINKRASGNVTDMQGRTVAACAGHTSNLPDSKHEEENNANADLIAAAPDILEALEWITRCCSMKGPAGTTAYIIKDDIMQAAKAAVAKAKGIKP